MVMAYLILFLLGGSALQYVLLRAENAKRRAGKRNIWVEGKSETEVEALGDKRLVWLILSSQQILFIANPYSGLDSFIRSRRPSDAAESFTLLYSSDLTLSFSLFASKNGNPYLRRQYLSSRLLLGILGHYVLSTMISESIYYLYVHAWTLVKGWILLSGTDQY